MIIVIGNEINNKVYVGNTVVKKIYLGNKLIYYLNITTN